MDAEWAMTDCDQDQNVCPWIVKLTVMDGIILLGQTNLLDPVDAMVVFLHGTEELWLVLFLQCKQKQLCCSQETDVPVEGSMQTR